MPPPTLVIETTRAAIQVAAGQTLSGGVAPALTLAHEVLKTMFLTKLKTGAALLCAGVVVALLGTGLTSTGTAQETTTKHLKQQPHVKNPRPRMLACRIGGPSGAFELA